MKKSFPYAALVARIEAYNQKKCELEEQKILAIFDYIGLTPEEYHHDACFNWDRILISVPDQDKFLELQQLELMCDKVEFILNRHSEAYFVCDYDDWRRASKGKGQDELRDILQSNFGKFSRN